MTINLTLGAHFDAFIAQQLASGRYADASEVVRDALRLLENRERRTGLFETAIEDGLADADAGRVYDADIVFDELAAVPRHASAVADYRAGRDEGVTQDEMQALLDAPTPLAFWRKKQGLTVAALAKAAQVAEREIETAESGATVGSSEMMAKVAAALKIGVEELI